jgi:hypothetical protein
LNDCTWKFDFCKDNYLSLQNINGQVQAKLARRMQCFAETLRGILADLPLLTAGNQKKQSTINWRDRSANGLPTESATSVVIDFGRFQSIYTDRNQHKSIEIEN